MMLRPGGEAAPRPADGCPAAGESEGFRSLGRSRGYRVGPGAAPPPAARPQPIKPPRRIATVVPMDLCQNAIMGKVRFLSSGSAPSSPASMIRVLSPRGRLPPSEVLNQSRPGYGGTLPCGEFRQALRAHRAQPLPAPPSGCGMSPQVTAVAKTTKHMTALLGPGVNTAEAERTRLVGVKLDIHGVASIVRSALHRGLTRP